MLGGWAASAAATAAAAGRGGRGGAVAPVGGVLLPLTDKDAAAVAALPPPPMWPLRLRGSRRVRGVAVPVRAEGGGGGGGGPAFGRAASARVLPV